MTSKSRRVFIYMNHRIKAKRPNGPVIRVQEADGSFKEGYCVAINGPSMVRFDPRGLRFATEHNVKAWIEADGKDVFVA